MGVFYETLPPALVPWLVAQKVFWIASAPLSGDGHVNVSPKGISDKGGPFFGVIRESKDGKRVLQSDSKGEGEEEEKSGGDKVVIRKFWYMDLTGSGIETTSHLHEPGNGRITVMFNAFDGPPRILRIFGKGELGRRMGCQSSRSSSRDASLHWSTTSAGIEIQLTHSSLQETSSNTARRRSTKSSPTKRWPSSPARGPSSSSTSTRSARRAASRCPATTLSASGRRSTIFSRSASPTRRPGSARTV